MVYYSHSSTVLYIPFSIFHTKVDRSINLGQKAWVEPWLPLGQVHVYKYMFIINMLKFIIKKIN